MRLSDIGLNLSSLITQAVSNNFFERLVTIYNLETDDSKILIAEDDVVIEAASID